MEQLKELLLQNNSSTLLGLGGIMELKKIYKIIDDTTKDIKEICFKDNDEIDKFSEFTIFLFCIALERNLEEAYKNEH